ncbi:ankyrin repeat domain-containing protein 12-like isoform X2 [Mya arenaria]|uniref:ankyrin repeat domain-containing protein 12-like isoform X2 n=1 Tax=Mya arenaria TaxID=6604 RepID=UPI0022E64509|nr:ankyrin repeat domain-containing protein 12-like isoform X2 [Mya arenaria]
MVFQQILYSGENKDCYVKRCRPKKGQCRPVLTPSRSDRDLEHVTSPAVCMPSLVFTRAPLPDMSDKKSPPRKEKPFLVRTPQPEDKGIKRKLLSPPSPSHDDDDKKTPNKRKRGSISCESSPLVASQKTPGGGSRGVPLSERQQLAMIMKMSDESAQDLPVKPSSPTPIQQVKKSSLDKKVFKRNARGEMPIHLAAINGDIKLIKKLIKAGADVNVADFAGWTPLHEASNRGWFSVAKQLLKAGANVNVQGLENDTPLHDAAINGHKKLVELLLKHGANPVQPNANGKTPLDVAASAEMVRVLKKETISSASDSSGIDDVRSPRSPDSVNSYRDDEKCLDEDSNHPNSRSGSFSSRRMSSGMPKSPDGKLSSPRLCLKFHRDHIGHQKSRDTTYSVTNMSVSDTDPMFSPDDSPASSVDSSDLLGFAQSSHVTHFSSHRVKITMPEEESLDFDMKQRIMVPNLNTDFSSTKEICPEKDLNENSRSSDLLPFLSNVSTSNDKQDGFSSLKTFGTLPFKPSSQRQFEDINSQSEDSLELPDLEIDTSNSRVNSLYKSETPDEQLTNSHDGENESVSSSAIDVIDQSSVSSTTVEQNSSFSTPPQDTNLENTVICSQSVTSSSVSPPVSQTNVTSADVINASNVLSSTSPTLTNTSNSNTTPSSSVTTVCSTESPTVINGVCVESDSQVQVKPEVTSPCSPSRTDRDSRDSRPSSPKVPPLKIIIPPKSQAPTTSPEANERLKIVVTNVKSALPYVINPYQNQSGENDPTNENPSELKLANHVQISINSQPLISNQVTSNSMDLNSFNSVNCDSRSKISIGSVNDRNGVLNEVSENIPMDVDSCDTGSALLDNTDEKTDQIQDNNFDESVSESGKCDSKSQSENREGRKGDAPQRVLRSTVRSQQLSSTETRPTKPIKPQEKPTERPPDKLEKNNGVDSSISPSESPITMLNNRPVKEDEENCIHPRKRKLKRSDCEHPESPDLYSSCGSTEKVPNPYEIYLSLRKKIASRRQGYLDMVSICPKTPQGFKDYLLKTCNYVLQGNNSSMLSVPTLSPPNSLKDKMRDMFVSQEESRYKLRLQHLIEREKLMLSIEQEILREHGRWARVLANQGTPLSVCTVLRDEEIYNFMEDQEEKDKKNRTRYNGRQFLSWIQDVDDKYEKIKELLILRQKQEADSLWAYQKLEWEWRLKEFKLCDRNATPDIDDIHVPLVTVYDNFELRPT